MASKAIRKHVSSDILNERSSLHPWQGTIRDDRVPLSAQIKLGLVM